MLDVDKKIEHVNVYETTALKYDIVNELVLALMRFTEHAIFKTSAPMNSLLGGMRAAKEK